jgi:hypothetical protein
MNHSPTAKTPMRRRCQIEAALDTGRLESLALRDALLADTGASPEIDVDVNRDDRLVAVEPTACRTHERRAILRGRAAVLGGLPTLALSHRLVMTAH